MAEWSLVKAHEDLIKHTTEKAYLLYLPEEIDQERWCVWLPNRLIQKRDFKSGIIEIHFPDDFEFKLIKEDRNDKSTKDINSKAFIELFNNYNVQKTDLLLGLNTGVRRLEFLLGKIDEAFEDIQAVNNIPESIDNEINDVDFSDLKLVIDNMKLAKARLLIEE